MSYNIAMDGPAGAGKSTIAKKAAARLGYIYVDTGAMYRALSLFFLRNRVNPDDIEKVAEKCREADVTISYENGEQVVWLNGENVNSLIRTEEVSMMTSKMSAIPAVREKLLSLQKKLAESENVIMDGRDIGTCVLPNADVKIYLTASVSVRAKRRYEEQKGKGIACTLEEVEENVRMRDEQDINRPVAPLRKAEDAILVDSSDMTIDQVVDEIIRICKEKGLK